MAGKTVINNVYTFMRGKTSDFTRARSVFDREKIYQQMLWQEKKLQPTYQGDCYVETARCYFSLPEDEWDKHKMTYQKNEAFGFIISNKYIFGLYKYCREARRDFAVCSAQAPNKGDEVVNRLIDMENVKVLAHYLLLDDVWVENEQVEVKLYTIYVLR